MLIDYFKYELNNKTRDNLISSDVTQRLSWDAQIINVSWIPYPTLLLGGEKN